MRPLQQPAFFDVESFPNFFCVIFSTPRQTKTKIFSVRKMHDTLTYEQIIKIRRIMRNTTLIGYNCQTYDLPMILRALNGATALELYQYSYEIINAERPEYAKTNYEVIDLLQVGPSPQRISLKLYGARLHCHNLQNLPYLPGTVLMNDEMRAVVQYCKTDLQVTEQLFNACRNRIKVRRALESKMRLSLISRSDTQIAETIMRATFAKNMQYQTPPKTIQFQCPKWIQFKSDALRAMQHDVCNLPIGLDDDFKMIADKAFRTIITLGTNRYKVGIGGLHSQEKSQIHITQKEFILFDIDVASYYPAIILNEKLVPKQCGPPFIPLYKKLTEQRLEAKRLGQKDLSDGLKIVINGSFGKFLSKYSILFDPQLFLQVVMTGQFALLMLIDMLYHEGISIVSANTDGLIVKVPRNKQANFHRVCEKWQKSTGFVLEGQVCRAIYIRDVSNYFYISAGGDVKGRGIFQRDRPLQKNPHANVCVDAVICKAQSNMPMSQYIARKVDIRDFCIVRQVTGGAQWGTTNLGKVARWIWGKGGKQITYAKNGNKVPYGQNAIPFMTLDQSMRGRVDESAYCVEAEKIYQSFFPSEVSNAK